MRRYGWPGNVRELRNVVERALMITSGAAVTTSALTLNQPNVEWRLEVPFPNGRSLHEVTADVARRILAEALRRGGSKQRAAELLGISRHALAHQLKALGLSA
jgi:transcriptional regulator with PAS, ATPase and Fis domain